MRSSGPKAGQNQVNERGEPIFIDEGFRDWIKEDSVFPPEKNRYHLYASYACPFASRTLLARDLKGLQNVIGLSVTHPVMSQTRPEKDDHIGWHFGDGSLVLRNANGHGNFQFEDIIPDMVNNAKTIRELYELSNDTVGKYSVPILWDKKNKKIVNNESSQIIRIFNSEFNDFAENPHLDLYPKHLQAQIDELNSWISSQLNLGVYKGGFATTQKAYEDGFNGVFAALDKIEMILSKNRYLCGDELTEADVRLYCTLIRFDPAYYLLFKMNHKYIKEYDHIREYTKELFQRPQFKSASMIDHIKAGYSGIVKVNQFGVIPKGPDPWWEQAHQRNKQF